MDFSQFPAHETGLTFVAGKQIVRIVFDIILHLLMLRVLVAGLGY